MKPEVVISEFFSAVFRPDLVTPRNKKADAPLSEHNFDDFMNWFESKVIRKVNLRQETNYFDDRERELIKNIVTSPIVVATGYPPNDKEAVISGSIYVFEGNWQETEKDFGPNYLTGRAFTTITVVGTTEGKILNIEEPTLIMRMLRFLLIKERPFFETKQMKNHNLAETPLAIDEQESYEYGFAKRSFVYAYDSTITLSR